MTDITASECVASRTRMHVALNVSNLTRSVAFYGAFLGVAPTKVRGEHYAKFTLDAPGLVLSLNVVPDLAPATALSHLGFQVADDAALDAARSRITGAGLEISLEEPGVTCCYAVQNKFWVEDPDGNAWEVYRFVEDAEGYGPAESRASSVPVASTSPCCGPSTSSCC